MRALKDLPASFWNYLEALPPLHDPDYADTKRPDTTIADRIEAHRLLPIRLLSSDLSPELRAELERRARRVEPLDARLAAAQAQTLERVRESLPVGSWIALKGIDYLRRFDLNPLWRPMGDIDLLVPLNEIGEQVARLKMSGLRVREDDGPLEVAMADPTNGVVIDLYRALIQPQRVAVDYDEIRRDCTPAADGVLMMSATHALVAHALTMANLQFVTHLRKYVDLWLLAQDPNVVEQALECVSRWRMRRAFFSSLWLLSEVIPETRDELWFAELERLISDRERRFLSERALQRFAVTSMPKRPVALFRKFSLIDDWSQRGRFVAAHAVFILRRAVRRGSARLMPRHGEHPIGSI